MVDCKPGEDPIAFYNELFLFRYFGKGVVVKADGDPLAERGQVKGLTSLTWKLVEVLPGTGKVSDSSGRTGVRRSGKRSTRERSVHSQSRMRGVNGSGTHRENVVGAVVRFDVQKINRPRSTACGCLHGFMKAKAHRSRLADVSESLAGRPRANDADQVRVDAAAG